MLTGFVLLAKNILWKRKKLDRRNTRRERGGGGAEGPAPAATWRQSDPAAPEAAEPRARST